MQIVAPMPYFGGKRTVAPRIWQALGDVGCYVEPFAGSLAVLLARPGKRHGVETVNDADGLLSNFWRAVAADPEAVARFADWPVNECDLHARHLWLIGQRESLTERLCSDPDWYDAKAAGWWCWGACCWIGSGWCAGDGPWTTDGERLVKRDDLGNAGMGIHRKLPHLSNAGQGIQEWFAALSDRLRGVRVACGDWSRVCGDSVLRAGTPPVGIVLDPPYAEGMDLYAGSEAGATASLWADVCAYAVDVGSRPNVRVVLCGYAGTFAPPAGWQTVEWKARGGYGSQGDGDGRANASRERLWLSPACLGATQRSLFDP
ncbi:DNA adenine methylase [Zavarzinia sp.]|uniref:DNA adenine methylase n=1 Tax=Zavarzinia sp. TaxID=2027920 RepID=UPI003568C884